MSAEQNKARALELFNRVLNGHDLAALDELYLDTGARRSELR